LTRIYGVGVDLVKLDRIERILARWENRFVGRLFTPKEAAFCFAREKRAVAAFGLHFAAKEAFSKAIGLGMRGGLRWRDIEVFHHRSGKPDLNLHGSAERLSRQRGICGRHLSLSDEGGFAMAMVVLECEAPLSNTRE
jgi:holo-[acyl-carrier protein] synthase